MRGAARTQVHEAGVGLGDDVVAVDDVGQVHARVLGGERGLILAEPRLTAIRTVGHVRVALLLVREHHAKTSGQAADAVVAQCRHALLGLGNFLIFLIRHFLCE